MTEGENCHKEARSADTAKKEILIPRFNHSSVGCKKHSNLINALLLLLTFVSLSSYSTSKEKPLTIREQGSFAVGGTVFTNPGTFDPYQPSPAGQTFRGDHAYVFYQIPAKARKYPLVMWHGFGQFSKTWETTPDGREGFQNIFLRRRFPVYLIDQPRRGDAGRSTVVAAITPTPDEQQWFGTFRIGIWPNYFEGVQFSRDSAALNQYFRSMTPSIGPIDINVNTNAVSALFNKGFIGRLPVSQFVATCRD
jgi:hypothetical protein